MTNYNKLKAFAHDLEHPAAALDDLTPIQFAAKYGEALFIQEQLQEKEPEVQQRIMNQTTPAGFTALHYAAYFGHIQCTEILLHFNADVTLVTLLQKNAMHLALSGNKKDTSKQTLLFNMLNAVDSTQSTLSQADRNGNTVAHLAAEYNLPEVLEVIQKKDKELANKKNNQNLTPLLVSILNQATKAEDILLDTNSVIQKDSKERSALHYGALYGSAACLKKLVPYFKEDLRDQDGHSAADYAKKDAKKLEILTEAYSSSHNNTASNAP